MTLRKGSVWSLPTVKLQLCVFSSSIDLGGDACVYLSWKCIYITLNRNVFMRFILHWFFYGQAHKNQRVLFQEWSQHTAHSLLLKAREVNWRPIVVTEWLPGRSADWHLTSSEDWTSDFLGCSHSSAHLVTAARHEVNQAQEMHWTVLQKA